MKKVRETAKAHVGASKSEVELGRQKEQRMFGDFALIEQIFHERINNLRTFM